MTPHRQDRVTGGPAFIGLQHNSTRALYPFAGVARATVSMPTRYTIGGGVDAVQSNTGRRSTTAGSISCRKSGAKPTIGRIPEIPPPDRR